MDSGNGNNQQPQQQRYCSTPIMPPPSPSPSPAMGGMHQPAHHPPPAISPHPSAYYGHHSAPTSSHYPTPSPTPPPPNMHHQQYYAHPHPYYPHGSHQQVQQSVGMSTPSPGPSQNQHPHLMSHGSYHPQQPPPPQSHHQQWGAPSPHAHPQQSHHYYHQTTHHTQQQQHGYPPPPHSPYPPYLQSHTPAPTPPPPQPPQQQQHPPPVAASPGPGQMHHQPPPVPPSSQPSQPNHALMNLSRFVSQQSTTPSPRASPSLAPHHQQQHISPMGPQSPSPFGGHLVDHHGNMNGHSSGMMSAGSSPPVMSPPPPPISHGQQAMSPPPTIPHQQQHHQPSLPHHLAAQSSVPYNVNGGSTMDRHVVPAPSPKPPHSSPEKLSKYDSLNYHNNESSLHHNKTLEKEREMHNNFPGLSPASSGHSTKDNVDHVNSNVVPCSVNREMNQISSSSASVKSNSNTNSSPTSHSGTTGMGNQESYYMPSSASSMQQQQYHNSSRSPPSQQHHYLDNDNNAGTFSSSVDIPSSNRGNDTETSPIRGNKNTLSLPASAASTSDGESSRRSSCSPQLKPLGSPTNAGNGHQMMPVRLQNMQKGARTKASMKKLMQEQQIVTPNGQPFDGVSDEGVSIKDNDLNLTEQGKGKGKAKVAKSPRKKKSQGQVNPDDEIIDGGNESLPGTSSNDLDNIANTLTSTGTTGLSEGDAPYIKPRKKLGRPRKISVEASVVVTNPDQEDDVTEEKVGRKRGGGRTSRKRKSSVVSEAPALESTSSVAFGSIIPGVGTDADTEAELASVQMSGTEQINDSVMSSPIRKRSNSPKKRSSNNLIDSSSDLQQAEPNSNCSHNDLSDGAIGQYLNKLSAVASRNKNVEATVQSGLTKAKGNQRNRKSKSTEKTQENALNDSLSSEADTFAEPIPTSAISEQLATSVASRIGSPRSRARSQKKGRRKSLKDAALVPVEEGINDIEASPTGKKRRQRKESIKNASPLKIEAESSPDRGDLPRLRSRSPKQSDSPPLRVSSPRAAKERSATPATTASGRSSGGRASRSREKETVSPIVTPLTSPALRQIKTTKVTEKEEEGTPRQKANRRKKAEESAAAKDSLVDTLTSYMSPPPMKRTRQMSKESSESTDPPSARARRRSDMGAPESRMSVDSDRSLSSVGKRSSRQKSSSIDNLLSPGTSPNSLSAVPAADPSIPLIEGGGMESDLTGADNIGLGPLKMKKRRKFPFTTPKRGKGKLVKKKVKQQVPEPANTDYIKEGESPVVPLPLDSFPVEPLSSDPLSASTPLVATEAVVPAVSIPKPRRRRKSSAKKGRKSKVKTATPLKKKINVLEQNKLKVVPTLLGVNGNTELEFEELNATPPVVVAKKRMGIKQAKKTRKSISSKSSAQDIESTIDKVVGTTQNGITSNEEKLNRKKDKKSFKKLISSGTLDLATSSLSLRVPPSTQHDPYQFDSSEPTVGPMASVADDNVQTAFVFSTPQLNSKFKNRRRSSSALSPENTQPSAKLNLNTPDLNKTGDFPLSPSTIAGSSSSNKSPKGNSTSTARRDSRVLSQDLTREVSIVLTDIAESFSIDDDNMPVVPDALIAPKSLNVPATDSIDAVKSSSMESSSPIDTSLVIKTEPNEVKKGLKRKRKSRNSTDLPETTEPPTKQIKKISNKRKQNAADFQQRKAALEAEVAHALIEMKAGCSNNVTSGSEQATTSPVKSNSSVSVLSLSPPFIKANYIKKRSKSSSIEENHRSVMISNSAENDLSLSLPVNQSIKKRTKPKEIGKRRKSRTEESPRVSVDQPAEPSVAIAAPQTLKKPRRRRTLNNRLTLPRKPRKITALDLTSPPVQSQSESTNVSSPVDMICQAYNNANTVVKVTKTALIPTVENGTTSSLNAASSPKKERKKRRTIPNEKPKAVKNKKLSVLSPDITSPITSVISLVQDSRGITATSTPIPSPKRKRTPKEKKKPNEVAGENNKSGSILNIFEGLPPPPPVVVQNVKTLPVKSSIKEKSFRKKTLLGTSVSDPLPSTSSIPSTSTNLVPFTPKPKPTKVPTIFAKSLPGLVKKDDDNQKNKGKDALVLKVIGTATKFFRGDGEEEVDPEPRLPKEKAPLPTDNAVPWTCSFCQLGPHAQRLGDLFGPYFANLPAKYGTLPKRETWMHGDCALWAGRLILVGTYLRKLEETLVDADKETCTICKRTGATVGCLHQRCKEAVHYPCAIRKSWKMDEQNFQSFCPQHKDSH